MNTKNAQRLIRYGVTVLLSWGLWSGVVSADSYSVNASVPYQVPSHAASILVPAAGASFENALQQVSGTCQLQNPLYTISIVRDGIVLGSTVCADGTFSVPITLALGQNNLVARTNNLNGTYGPDSVVTAVTLKTPTVVAPLPTGTLEPTTQNVTAVTNQGALSGLVVTSQAPSTALEETKTAAVRIVVTGGQQPYSIQLQWGDGSTESHSFEAPGTYDFSHTYSTQKNYSLRVYVRDVLGAFAEYSYAIVSSKRATNTTTSNSSASNTVKGAESPVDCGVFRYRWTWWLLWILFLIILLLASLLAYKRGYKRGAQSLEKDNPGESAEQ